MKICVIIPAHNESENIGEVVKEIKAKNLDVVVIDDGSVDHSGKIAEEKGAIVLKNEKKQGKGRSLQKGFDYALQHNYDGVITMDGDGQHAPSDLDNFIEKIETGVWGVVVGNRMGQHKQMPLVRYLTNRLMSSLISALCKHNIPDSQCGYRYIHSDVLKRINLSAKDFEIETEVLLKAAKKGSQIASVPIKTIYRNEHSKISPLKDTIRFFIYIVKEMCSSEND